MDSTRQKSMDVADAEFVGVAASPAEACAAQEPVDHAAQAPGPVGEEPPPASADA